MLGLFRCNRCNRLYGAAAVLPRCGGLLVMASERKICTWTLEGKARGKKLEMTLYTLYTLSVEQWGQDHKFQNSCANLGHAWWFSAKPIEPRIQTLPASPSPVISAKRVMSLPAQALRKKMHLSNPFQSFYIPSNRKWGCSKINGRGAVASLGAWDYSAPMNSTNIN